MCETATRCVAAQPVAVYTGPLQRRRADLWDRNLRQDDRDFQWPEGESYREFRARVDDTLADIARRHDHEAVLIVTHAGGVISQWLGMLAGTNPARWDFCRPGYPASRRW